MQAKARLRLPPVDDEAGAGDSGLFPNLLGCVIFRVRTRHLYRTISALSILLVENNEQWGSIGSVSRLISDGFTWRDQVAFDGMKDGYIPVGLGSTSSVDTKDGQYSCLHCVL